MTIWNLLFDVDLETSSKIKLIYIPTHYFCSIPFSAVNSVFVLTFSGVCQIYVAQVLIYTFLQLLPSVVFITIWVPKWGQFFEEVNSRSGSRSIFGLQLFELNLGSTPSLTLQSHLSLTLDHVVGDQLWIPIHLLSLESKIGIASSVV